MERGKLQEVEPCEVTDVMGRGCRATVVAHSSMRRARSRVEGLGPPVSSRSTHRAPGARGQGGSGLRGTS